MEKLKPQLLFCCTECPLCLRVVDYLKTLFAGSSLHLTLYHLIEIPFFLLLPQRDFLKEIKREESLEKFCLEAKEKILMRFEKIAQSLRQSIDLQVDYLVEFTEGDKAESVLHFLRGRTFSGVVMVKRGFSRLASIWAGSFTQKMILYTEQPLWIIRAQNPNNKILVAFDLGERGLRVNNYSLNILSTLENYEAIFFHVLRWFGFTSHFEDSLAALLEENLSSELRDTLIKVRELPEKYEIPEDGIKFKLIFSIFGPASAILIKKVRKRGYTTLVVGKEVKEVLLGFSLAYVATKLIRTLEKEALWLVP